MFAAFAALALIAGCGPKAPPPAPAVVPAPAPEPAPAPAPEPEPRSTRTPARREAPAPDPGPVGEDASEASVLPPDVYDEAGTLVLSPVPDFGTFDAWDWLEGATDSNTRGLLSRAWIGASLAGEGSNVPAPLIGALLLGRHAIHTDSELLLRLSGFFQEAKDLDLSGDLEYSLLAFAAGLRAALLAPAIDPATFLQRVTVPDDFPTLGSLLRAFIDSARWGLPIDLQSEQGAQRRLQLQQAMASAADKLAAWKDFQFKRRIKLARATDLLHDFCRDEDKFGGVLDAIAADSPDAAELARERIKQLESEESIRKLIRAHEKKMGGKSAGEPIIAGAYRSLLQAFLEGRDLLHEWLVLHEELHESGGGGRGHAGQGGEQAAAGHARVVELLEPAHVELAALAERKVAPAVRVAAHWLGAELASVRSLVEGTTVMPSRSPADAVLWSGLLYIEGLALEEWGPRVEPEVVGLRTATERIVERLVASRANDTFEEALDAHLRAAAIGSARRLVALEQRHHGLPPIEVERHSERIDSELDKARASVRRIVDDAAAQVEKQTGFLLSENERAELLGLVERARAELKDGGEDLGFLKELVGIARARVDDAVHTQREKVVRELERRSGGGDAASASERPLPPALAARISGFVDDNHMQLAQALLDLSKRVDNLDELENLTEPPSEADAFFGEFLGRFEKATAKKGRLTQSAVLQALDPDRPVPSWPFATGRLERDERANARELVRAWYSLFSSNDAQRGAALGKFFSSLQFPVESVKKERHVGGRTTYTVEFEASSSPRISQLSRYGSKSGGRFTIILFFQNVDHAAMFDAASAHPDQAVILIPNPAKYILKRSDRRTLWAQCLLDRRSLLVLDEAAVLFIASTGQTRRRVFFDTLTPFSYDEPYVVGASYVEPEMFFGRREERREILAPHGACLVYGGRQLGKSSLLRDIVRQRHDPRAGWHVYYLDLATGGHRQSAPAQVLDTVFRILTDAGILSGTARSNASRKAAIQDWLQDPEHPGRRILILVDEADAFLEADADPAASARGAGALPRYAVVRFLKSLMEDTRGAFKVVFAGLHDVQRSRRDPNSPLAQLRQPLCIGPLLKDGEWLEALAMVQNPYKALGFRFESTEVALLVLQYANFYPSLIQLFCKRLLEQLTRNRGIVTKNPGAPPVMVRRTHVEGVWQKREVREEIRSRFEWTLDLDPRYRIIAYVVVLETLANEDVGVAEGFTAAEIRDQVLGYWERGFHQDASLQRFRGLLNEMVGLGVLQDVRGDRFALRSPMLVPLFGQKTDVEDSIQELASRDVQQAPNPGRYRAPLPDGTRRALEARAEFELLYGEHPVMVVLGTPLGGIQDVASSVEAACAATSDAREKALRAVVLPDRVRNLAQFRDFLTAVGRSTRSNYDGEAVIVPSPVDWSYDWFEAAKAAAGRRQSRILRVILVGTDRHAWRLLRRGPPAEQLLALEPWDPMWQADWLMEAGGLTRALAKEAYGCLGGWGGPLGALLQARSRGRSAEGQLETVRSGLVPAAVLAHTQLRRLAVWLAGLVAGAKITLLEFAEYYELFLDELTPAERRRMERVLAPEDPRPFLEFLDLFGFMQRHSADPEDPAFGFTPFAVDLFSRGDKEGGPS